MDFMLSGHFICCGEDKHGKIMGLESRQKSSLLDKDGVYLEDLYSDDEEVIKHELNDNIIYKPAKSFDDDDYDMDDEEEEETEEEVDDVEDCCPKNTATRKKIPIISTRMTWAMILMSTMKICPERTTNREGAVFDAKKIKNLEYNFI